MTASSQYDWWSTALEAGQGRELTREQIEKLGNTLEPRSGFYRRRAYKDGPYVAIAIWRDDSKLWCLQNGTEKECDDVMWSYCCRWPISEDLYHSVTAGGAWPDEPPSVPRDHNQVKTGDPHTDLQREFEAEAEMAESFLRKPITTQEQADQAAVWSKRVAAIAKKATDLHKVEKQPSLDESRRIDDLWRDLKEKPADLSKRLKRHMDAFLQEQDRLEQERQRKAREEAARIQREADEAARKAVEARQAEEDQRQRAASEEGSASQFARETTAEADRIDAERRAQDLKRQAEEAAREAEARNSSAGRTGAKVALRTFVSARVTDYEAAALAMIRARKQEILDVIDTLANRAVKSDVVLPGVERVEERRAA